MKLRVVGAFFQIAFFSHFLHFTSFYSDDVIRVAEYVLHYADGRTAVLPVDYGKDIRDWWNVFGEPAETADAVVVWTGSTPMAGRLGHRIRLWMRTYENPRPEVEITSIDLISEMAQPSPCIIALTVE